MFLCDLGMVEGEYMPENGTTPEEALAESVLGYIKELSELKFSSEEKREQNLIQQSSHMQTVFSFVSVTVLMVFPILMEKIQVIPPSFFFWSATTILLPLFASLLIS